MFVWKKRKIIGRELVLSNNVSMKKEKWLDENWCFQIIKYIDAIDAINLTIKKKLKVNVPMKIKY